MTTRPHDAFLFLAGAFLLAGAVEVFNTVNREDAKERCDIERSLHGTPQYNKDREVAQCNRYIELNGNYNP